MACASDSKNAHSNSSLHTKDLMKCMASVENLNNANKSGPGSPSDDVEFIKEKKCKRDDHRCDLCCKGEFLVDKLAQFGQKIETNNKYMCGICDQSFRNSSSYRKHMVTPCSPKPRENGLQLKTVSSQSKMPKKKISVTCTICNRTLTSHHGLFSHHVKQHSGVTHNCSVCNEVFSSFRKFTYHCYQHEWSSKRKHRCLECGERFTNKCHFERHLKLHEI